MRVPCGRESGRNSMQIRPVLPWLRSKRVPFGKGWLRRGSSFGVYNKPCHGLQAAPVL